MATKIGNIKLSTSVIGRNTSSSLNTAGANTSTYVDLQVWLREQLAALNLLPGLCCDNDSLAITAHAGGGQASAYQLTRQFNKVTVVATAADSVKLPAAHNGMGAIYVANADSTDSLNVYPPVGEYMNGTINAAQAIAAGASAIFVPGSEGHWVKVATI